MAKYKNNNVSKVLLIVLSVLLIGGTATIAYASEGFKNWDTATWFKPEEKPEEEESPIKLKMLKEETLEDGTIRKIVSYTLTPEDSTIKEVEATAKYEDGSSCDEVISVSVNKDLQQVTLDFKADFDKKIIVTLKSKSNPEVTATITCDYEKRLSSYSLKNNSNLIYSPSHNFSIDDFINVVYSKYTIDKNYTFKLENISRVELDQTKSANNINKAKSICAESTITNIFDSDNFGMFINNQLHNLTSASPKNFPTAETIWNFETGDAINQETSKDKYRLILLDQKTNDYDPWYYTFSASIQAYDNDKAIGTAIQLNKISIGFDLKLDYSSLMTQVQSVTPEVNHLVI